MRGNRAVIAAVVAVALIAGGWWLFRRGSGAPQIDLVEQFSMAERRPAERTFNVTDVNLNGEAHKAIEMEAPSRITWKVRIPDDAWLRVYVGMKPESWTAEGDGVLFLVGVSDTRTFDKLFEQNVNPFNNPGDRKWIPVMVDLSSYAGEEVSVIFNALNGLPGKTDTRNDFAVWGAPQIVSK